MRFGFVRNHNQTRPFDAYGVCSPLLSQFAVVDARAPNVLTSTY